MQGYVTVALDRSKYVDMAVNLARSLKYFDPKRPTCLVYNDRVSLPPEAAAVFDHAVKLDIRPDYVGCMNKTRIFDVTPFDESMYIDADCLLVKNDIDCYWQRLQPYYFGMTGEKRSSGVWNKLDFAKACAALAIPYIVQMNSGVFYFRKNAEAKALFDYVHDLFENHRDLLSNIHQGRTGQYADEPFFGAAMGKFGIGPVDGVPSEDSWMVTTWRARNCRFDPIRGVATIEKPAGFWFGLPLVARGWVKHSPTVAHFIGLAPKKVYADTAAFFAEALARKQTAEPVS